MKGKNTRELLLAAAEKMLLSEGWEGISIRKLGSAAGLSYAALYRHFSSLEDLKKALVERQYRQFLDYVHRYRSREEAKEGPVPAGPAARRRDLLLSCLGYLHFWHSEPNRFDLYRRWVEEGGLLAFREPGPEDSPGPLVLELAAWTSRDAGDLRVRTDGWFLETVLFGLAQASRAEQSAGSDFDEPRYRDYLETLLGGLRE